MTVTGTATPDLVDLAVLRADELVTDAHVHGAGPVRQVRHRADRVRVEVRDGGHACTAALPGWWDLGREGGRGLPAGGPRASSWDRTGDDTAGSVTGATVSSDLGTAVDAAAHG